MCIVIPGGTPYNDLYREAPPKRGTFSRLQRYQRVGISPVEVNQRVGNSVFSLCKITTEDFMAAEKKRKFSGFVI